MAISAEEDAYEEDDDFYDDDGVKFNRAEWLMA